ncbi:Flp family type IVb pilin [Caulobacter ginsengisoli]|uniref:Flp family type IVb pilin n=1 Tax=Caulobacter ginsengisoli TaxID=400775 RepID=UPI00352070B1
MGQTRSAQRLPHAAGGPAAGRLSARFSLKSFWRDESGATAIEYGLIASLIFLVIVTSVTAFGNKTTDIMDRVSAAIAGAIS